MITQVQVHPIISIITKAICKPTRAPKIGSQLQLQPCIPEMLLFSLVVGVGETMLDVVGMQVVVVGISVKDLSVAVKLFTVVGVSGEEHSVCVQLTDFENAQLH